MTVTYLVLRIFICNIISVLTQAEIFVNVGIYNLFLPTISVCFTMKQYFKIVIFFLYILFLHKYSKLYDSNRTLNSNASSVFKLYVVHEAMSTDFRAITQVQARSNEGNSIPTQLRTIVANRQGSRKIAARYDFFVV